MAITTMDGLVAALAARPITPFNKASTTSKAAGSFHSLWKVNGFPAAGSNPATGTGAIPTKKTVGAVPFADAGGTNETYLGKIGATGATAGTLITYDRLWANSGLNGTLNTAQACNSIALTRHTDGIGVEAFLEVYTATGSTAVTATMSYTNTDGVSGRSATAALIATPVVGQMIPFMLDAGDKGILSVQSVTLSATTGTAGNFGVTLMKRKCSVPLPVANIGQELDGIAIGMPGLETNACLAFMVQCTATNTGQILGTLCIAEG